MGAFPEAPEDGWRPQERERAGLLGMGDRSAPSIPTAPRLPSSKASCSMPVSEGQED